MTVSRNRQQKKTREKLERRIKKETIKFEFDFTREQLQWGGPSIITSIHVPDSHAQALRDAGQPVPEPVRCRFLIDTGAQVTLVRHEIAERAGLKLISSNATIQGIGVDTTGRVYMGRIQFSVPSRKVPEAVHNVYVDTQVMSGSLENKQLDGLIGRDVLRYFDLQYNGETGKVTMKYLRPGRPGAPT